MRCGIIVIVALLANVSDTWAVEVFRDDFTGPLMWTTSDSSVYVKDGQYLYLGTNGKYGDYVTKMFTSPIDLLPGQPVVVEQRLRLASGGLNYRLPAQEIYFEGTAVLGGVTYLPSYGPSHIYGWRFGFWTGNDDHPVPGDGYWTAATADYWAVTRIIITPTGGELQVKPDDAARGWYDGTFYTVATNTWSHSQLQGISFSQPWDAECYIDYVSVTVTPEPTTVGLLAVGGFGVFSSLVRRRRADAPA